MGYIYIGTSTLTVYMAVVYRNRIGIIIYKGRHLHNSRNSELILKLT